jgi:acyl-coenzyme A thioesterase PaaI-like protein
VTTATLVAVPGPEVNWSNFERHPGLRGRQREALAMANELRRLIRLSVSTAPPADVTSRLTARLAAMADELEAHQPTQPLPRFIQPDGDGPRPGEPIGGSMPGEPIGGSMPGEPIGGSMPGEPIGGSMPGEPIGGSMPYDVVVGPFNPIALPVVLDFEPPKARGLATFDVTYEGAPGCVHGAILAATFDIVLTAANAVVGATGPTVRLALRYKRPTLIDTEAVFEGWVTELTERRVHSRGRIVQDGIETVEAEGEFAIFNREGVNRMAAKRRDEVSGGPMSREGHASRERREGHA